MRHSAASLAGKGGEVEWNSASGSFDALDGMPYFELGKKFGNDEPPLDGREERSDPKRICPQVQSDMDCGLGSCSHPLVAAPAPKYPSVYSGAIVSLVVGSRSARAVVLW